MDAYFGSLPQYPGARDELLHHCSDLITKAPLLAEVSRAYDTKDLVNGVVGWESAVEDGELPLETWGDVVAAPSRVDHGSYQLDVLNVCEVSWFLMTVEPSHFHQLPHNLIGHLHAWWWCVVMVWWWWWGWCGGMVVVVWWYGGGMVVVGVEVLVVVVVEVWGVDGGGVSSSHCHLSYQPGLPTR